LISPVVVHDQNFYTTNFKKLSDMHDRNIRISADGANLITALAKNNDQETEDVVITKDLLIKLMTHPDRSKRPTSAMVAEIWNAIENNTATTGKPTKIKITMGNPRNPQVKYEVETPTL
ncbi:MAG: hypothetical protein HQK51_14730, partial [Oligoflexia bacterium]|nr:hypothetical protein [Oligoflexia bacterium]